MNKKIVCAAIVLFVLCAVGKIVPGQENKTPVTKEEIIRLLKPAPGSRFEQGDLAAEISQRGISFTVDEATLAELRKAGARSFLIEAIQHAAEDAARPKLKQPLPPEAQPPPPKEDDSPAARAAALAKLPLLEQARYHAAEFMEELPNFIATQFVTRSVRTPEHKDWKVEDKLELELSYRIKTGEQFKVISLNGKPSLLAYEQLGGATSTGEFGSILSALFVTESNAEFKEIRLEAFRGHQTVVFDFRVKKGNSGYSITDKTSKRTVTAGYSGSVWIELESARVLRIEQSAENIQSGFPITMAESAVEYDWVTIGRERYLMPVSAEIILGQERERFYSRNVIELRGYHLFETDVKITGEKDPQ